MGKEIGPLDSQVLRRAGELESQVVDIYCYAFIAARELVREFPMTRCRTQKG